MVQVHSQPCSKAPSSVVASSGPRSFCRFCRCSILFSCSFWRHQIRSNATTSTQQLQQLGRISAAQPQHPSFPGRTHTHTHRTGAERGRAKAPNWSTTSADIIDAATGHCGGPSGFPREHAAARIFETSLAPGASTGNTVSPYPRPGGWRRPNEHRRLRHAIAQPPSPRRNTPRRDETLHPSPDLDEATTYVIVCKLKLLKDFSFYGEGRLQGRCGNRLVTCME